jgi:RNA polymerase sigma-70 factor (ECF subfamily)
MQYNEDAALLEDFLNGGDGLVRKYHPLIVWLFLRESGSITHEDAEDLAQNLWIIISKKASSIRDRRTFHAWLRTIVHRQALNFYTRRKALRLLHADDHCITLARENDDSADFLCLSEQGTHVGGALARLSDQDREVLTLRYWQGLTIAEIARLITTEEHPEGIPVGTVKRRLHIARGRFAEEFKTYLPDGKPGDRALFQPAFP